MSLDKFKIEFQAKDLIGHFDPEAKIEIIIEGEGCRANVDTEISGLLIGRHGETLEALQHVLRLMLAKEAEGFVPVTLDIASYRSLRLKEFEELAKNLAEKVLENGGTESLPPMSSYERRQMHLILQDIEGIIGESEGEEPERRIVIKPKTK